MSEWMAARSWRGGGAPRTGGAQANDNKARRDADDREPGIPIRASSKCVCEKPRTPTGNWSDRSAPFRGAGGASATYALTRLLLLLIPFGLFPYPYGTAVANDVTLYSSWAQVIAAGHFPINDPMWQYPPLAGFVFLLGAHVTSNPILGFVVLALIADAIIFFLLLRIGMRTRHFDGAWTYAIGGMLVGPVLLTRFDVFPTLFAVLALLALAKPVRSGFLMGIGALLKVWPALLIVALPRRSLAKGTAALLATGLAGLMAISTYGPGAFSFLKEQGDRGLQIESVGGAFFLIRGFFGGNTTTTFRYGSMEIAATGAGAVASIVTIAGLVAIGWVGYLRLRGRLESASGADVGLTVILISIASSRVFSPQYLIWVIGIAGVCMLDRKTRMRPVVYLALATALAGQFVYPAFYSNMVQGGWYGTAVQVLRIALLLTATVWAMIRIMAPAEQN